MIAKIYYEGYWMGLQGEPREANPHVENEEPESWRSWDDGWEDAQQECVISER